MKFARMTDPQLARALSEALEGRDEDTIVLAENEIAGRLDLDPDETEQGLTADSVLAIDLYVERYKGRLK